MVSIVVMEAAGDTAEQPEPLSEDQLKQMSKKIKSFISQCEKLHPLEDGIK